MALVTANGDSVSAFKNRQRVRTMNYHGSLTTTVVTNGDSWGSGTNGDILYLTLVPFGAVLKSIKVSFDATHQQLAYKVGIAGINPDRTLTEIKDNLVTVAAPSGAVQGGTIKEILPATSWWKTLYQQLCNGYTPIDAFAPYKNGEYGKNSEYGVLYFKLTAKNTGALATVRVAIDWVDPSPSETPKINRRFGAINARDAA